MKTPDEMRVVASGLEQRARNHRRGTCDHYYSTDADQDEEAARALRDAADRIQSLEYQLYGRSYRNDGAGAAIPDAAGNQPSTLGKESKGDNNRSTT